MPASKETISALQAKHGGLAVNEFRGQTRVVVPAAQAFDVLKTLKEALGFDLLVDVTCVDYLNYRDAADRFGLVYLLANTISSERLTVRVFLNEPNLSLLSVVPLWEGAN